MNEQNAENTSLESKSTPTSPDIGKPKSGKKKIIIISAAIIALIAIAVVILIPLLSENAAETFERVKSECVRIAGRVKHDDGYFFLDTYPDDMKAESPLVQSMLLPDIEEDTLEAIRHANKEFGFDSNLCTKMIETPASAGYQSVENDDYLVSWIYREDDGLEVAYRLK